MIQDELSKQFDEYTGNSWWSTNNDFVRQLDERAGLSDERGRRMYLEEYTFFFADKLEEPDSKEKVAQ